MPTLRVLDLFSGIGGFSLGLERAGMQTVAFCEIDANCRSVLAEHWPDVPIHGDVTQLHAKDLQDIDLICGGFPCQDLSVAGRQGGLTGARSGLWSEFRRLIGELRPRYVLIENVNNLLHGEEGGWFASLLSDLAALRYDAEWHCLPAAYVGAYHIRDRVWILAYTDGWRTGTFQTSIKRNASRVKLALRCRSPHTKHKLPLDCTRIYRRPDRDIPYLYDGIPEELAAIHALGNAVVPQVAEVLGRAIVAVDTEREVR